MTNQKKKTIQTYKQKDVVEMFDKERNKYAFQKYKHKIEANFLKKTIASLKQDKIKILDVACGTGRMLLEVFSIGKEIEYAGLDTSKEMISILKKRAEKLGIKKKVKIKIGDATKMPFKDNSFDVVYSFHLLWHLPEEDQEKIIKEMLRVCKKDGFIVFDVLNENFIWEKIKRKKTEEIYKLQIDHVKGIIGDRKIEIEKLNDFPVKNSFFYGILNIMNDLRVFLPQYLYHMLFFRVRK
ncbi:MAG: class I SAM-dependent methyltransferase [Candidatus Pacearchaeota archaeon]